ncbi:hypothetical protein C8Q77DRAFT_1088936 [Trametes polyzona]|nr:hypothetical protein C8Q77DRAFT_1088936 [Trametes polyzona]
MSYKHSDTTHSMIIAAARTSAQAHKPRTVIYVDRAKSSSRCKRHVVQAQYGARTRTEVYRERGGPGVDWE